MSFNLWVLAWVLIPLVFVIVLTIIYWSGGKGIDPERIKSEFKRWKDWAGTLLIVMTVLLAFNGSLLGDVSNKWVVLLGGVIGFVGIFLVAMWYTGEGFWERKNKPVLLRLGSMSFGVQTVMFLLAFVIKQIN